MTRSSLGLFVLAVVFLNVYAEAVAQPLDLILPTSNTAMLDDDGADFYQYTDRTFDGRHYRPWQGGQYGFVRNPKHTADGIVFTRFHEGVDIKPLYRDRHGEPLDTVRTIDDGRVVYVNDVARESSYGKYVVVEHWWSGSPFYSLYAHLNRVYVRAGQRVCQGDRLGRLGYTGRGINRRRAHVHFEINMLVNANFQEWYDEHYRSPNHHGIFNGLNLTGLDVAALYTALRDQGPLTIQDFFVQQQPFFKVTVPATSTPDLLYRYWWLVPDDLALQERAPGLDRVAGWDISFTRSGLPLRVAPARHPVAGPKVSSVDYARISYGDLTNRLVAGRGNRYWLGTSGERYIGLVTTPVHHAASENLGVFRKAGTTDKPARILTW